MSNTFFLLLILAAFFLSIGQSKTGREVCYERCITNKQCLTVQYDEITNFCRLVIENNFLKAPPKLTKTNIQTGIQTTTPTPTPTPTTTPTATRHPIIPTTISECESSCQSLPYCVAFYFDEQTGSCEKTFDIEKSNDWESKQRVYKLVI